MFRDFKKEKEDNEELMRKIQGLDDLQKRLKMDKKA